MSLNQQIYISANIVYCAFEAIIEKYCFLICNSAIHQHKHVESEHHNNGYI